MLKGQGIVTHARLIDKQVDIDKQIESERGGRGGIDAGEGKQEEEGQSEKVLIIGVTDVSDGDDGENGKRDGGNLSDCKAVIALAI